MSSDVRIATDVAIDQDPRWAAVTAPLSPAPFVGIVGDLMQAARTAMTWQRYDVVITGSVRRAALYGCLKRLLPCRAPRIMLLEARFDDPQPRLSWRAKVLFQRIAFSAVDAICVSARAEILDYSTRLGLPPHRFHFVPWHTNVISPAIHSCNEGYVFSAGRTGRDWETLSVAAKNVQARFVAVMSRSDSQAIHFPSNVETYVDIPYESYRRLLEQARIVVVPLQVHAYSSGQVALLEAMSLGKPVVCTRVLGTEDYLRHGENGLFVLPNDPDSLAATLDELLANRQLEAALGRRALQTILEKHTFGHYVNNVLSMAKITARSRGARATQ